MSPKGECWKISAAVNSITGAQPDSAGLEARRLEPTTRYESGGPVSQASLGVKPVFGSTIDECAASGAGSIHPSSDDAIFLGFRSEALAGAISQALSDSRSTPCSS